ncbi:MAG TPA: hypothetical protein VNM92_07000 [Thermoanaerobaculia bacterium]|nr:hypothetical protein [Thermoanaerobaculia bacterium]
MEQTLLSVGRNVEGSGRHVAAFAIAARCFASARDDIVIAIAGSVPISPFTGAAMAYDAVIYE